MGKAAIVLVVVGGCSVSCIRDWIHGGSLILPQALGAMLKT